MNRESTTQLLWPGITTLGVAVALGCTWAPWYSIKFGAAPSSLTPTHISLLGSGSDWRLAIPIAAAVTLVLLVLRASWSRESLDIAIILILGVAFAAALFAALSNPFRMFQATFSVSLAWGAYVCPGSELVAFAAYSYGPDCRLSTKEDTRQGS